MRAVILLFACVTGAASELPEAIHLDSLSPALADAVVEAHGQAKGEVAGAKDAASRAQAWGRLGMFLHAQHLALAAEWAYGLALTEHNDPRWRHLRGVVLEERGEIERAAADYREAVRLDHGDFAATVRLARAVLLAGDHEAAARILDQLGQGRGDAAIMLAVRADIAIAQERWQAAADLLERAYTLEPDAGALAYKLAMVHRRLGNGALTREWLARRGDANAAPKIDDPLLLEVASLSLSARFYVKVGEWALERGDTRSAVDSLARAAALDPDDVDVGLTYANVLGVAGRPADAIAEVRRVLGIDRQSAHGWYLLAWLMRTMDEESHRLESLMAVRRSLRLAEDDRTRVLAAAFSMRERRFKEAMNDYEILLSGNPDKPAYYLYWLSLARLGLGDCDAREPLARALELQRGWGEAHLVLARADAICGDAARARWRVAALLKIRDDVDTRMTLAMVELASGNREPAAELATVDLPHPDAEMILDSLGRGGSPVRPFARGSPWWVPPEIRSGLPSIP